MLPKDFLIGQTTWQVLESVTQNGTSKSLRVLCLQYLQRWLSQGGGEHAVKGQRGSFQAGHRHKANREEMQSMQDEGEVSFRRWQGLEKARACCGK